MTFQVSVIIPVYNAAPFLREAVQSALTQSEVQEVLLIEDSSTDDSLIVCQQLASEQERVTLLRHEGGINRGAGASRNLGIANSQYSYIAFLDADDVYLPGRFTFAAQIFLSQPSCDGVYEAVGTLYQDAESERIWREVWTENHDLTTLEQPLPPERLFAALLWGGYGHIHLNGLTLRASLLKRIGGFSEELRIAQDTALCIQAAALGNLMPGRLTDPVAMRRVHAGNRITQWRQSPAQVYELRAALADYLAQWGEKHKVQSSVKRALNENRAVHAALARSFNGISTDDIRSLIISRARLIREMMIQPKLCFSRVLWKRLFPQVPYKVRQQIRRLRLP
jgi:hypothetical protein